jgi:THO complex subunit 2
MSADWTALITHVESTIDSWSTLSVTDFAPYFARRFDDAISTPSTLATLPITAMIHTLLTSKLTLEELVEFFSGQAERIKTNVGDADRRIEALTELIADEVDNITETHYASTLSRDLKLDDRAPEKGLKMIRILTVRPRPTSPPLSADYQTNGSLTQAIVNAILSPENLEKLELLPTTLRPRTPAALNSLSVKRNTALFYKQNKFNLLREASEGYAKLIDYLCSRAVIVSPHDPDTDNRRHWRAEKTMKTINMLIGQFDLAPPRVLDIILDIANLHLKDQWEFFVELFNVSAWRAKFGSGEDGGGTKVLTQVLGAQYSFPKVCQDTWNL